ncbi:sortase domain-containing protein [Nocardioides alcanivorans]|uniref:sortase domain-containing protein n=1 Tax=Nocardioides alcanivorans TaxID=2897352 RepID=UPI001F381126|nr:sortase [Nocardioides alcanivorans]
MSKTLIAVERPAGPERGRPRDEESLRLLSTALTMVGVLALWFVCHVFVFATVSQERQQAVLYDQLRADMAAATAPVGPIVAQGTPVSLLTIPALDLEQVVVEGTTSGDLLAGPGHRRDTVLPGQVGNSVVYGRSSTYGAPFKEIADLRTGDRIRVDGAQGTVDFAVIGVRRAGDLLPAPATAGAARLTLATSEGRGRLDALSRGEVVYVDAEAKEGFPAPSGRLGAVNDEERAMGTDPGILPRLVLLMALLVLLTIATVVARQRWSAVLTWVVAAPIAGALTWATTDAAMRLLPNLV